MLLSIFMSSTSVELLFDESFKIWLAETEFGFRVSRVLVSIFYLSFISSITSSFEATSELLYQGCDFISAIDSQKLGYGRMSVPIKFIKSSENSKPFKVVECFKKNWVIKFWEIYL